MSAWSDFKKKAGNKRPWDISYIEKTEQEQYEKRMSICESCDRFFELTKQCKECKCVMPIKARIKQATCPLNKW